MVIHDIDVPSALSQYIIDNSISTVVLGASSRSALTRYVHVTPLSHT